MANIDFPSGLRAIRNQNGDAPRIQALDSVSTVVYKGAFAIMSTTGLVGLASSSVLTSAIMKKCVGVFAEHKAAGAAGPEGNIRKALVYVDPDQLYVIQSDDNSLASVTNFMYRNFSVIGMTAGDSLGNSTGELDGSTGTSITTSSIATSLKVLEEYSDSAVDGDLTTWGKFIVKINPKFHMAVNNLGV